MAPQKEAIDLPICMHGFSIVDEFLMQTRHTNLYMLVSEYGMADLALIAVCFFTAHYFNAVLFLLNSLWTHSVKK